MSFIPLDTKDFLVTVAKAVELMLRCQATLISDSIRIMSDQLTRIEADPETPVIAISGQEVDRQTWIDGTRAEIQKRNQAIEKMTDMLAKFEK